MTDNVFRTEVRAFLAEALTPEIKRAGELMTSVFADFDATMDWHKTLYAKGWVAPDWPKEYGGTGWSSAQKFIYETERAQAGVPDVLPFVLKMMGPVIYNFGTDEQKTKATAPIKKYTRQ